MNSRLLFTFALLNNHQCFAKRKLLPSLLRSRALYSSEPPPKKESDLKKFIYLLDAEGKHLGTKSFSEAQTIAKKHRFLLVCCDKKTKYPTYKLESKNSQFATKSDMEIKDTGDKINVSSKKSRDIKNLVIASKISEHDLATKMDLAKKWLKSGDKVNMVVTGDAKQFENIFSNISVLLKEYATLKQKQKKSNLKFVCVPNVEVPTTVDKPQARTEIDAETEINLNDIVNKELQELLKTKK